MTIDVLAVGLVKDNSDSDNDEEVELDLEKIKKMFNKDKSKGRLLFYYCFFYAKFVDFL